MRLFILISILVSLSFSIHSRELTMAEKLTVRSLESANIIHEFMVDNIDSEQLTKKEKILFYVTKRGCDPINKEIDSITQTNDDEATSRLTQLTVYMAACKEAMISVTRLYIKYQ